VPGVQSPFHAYWLYPIMVDEPKAVCEHMFKDGFDVTQGTTQLGPLTRYVKN
jgi:hypothetical protein